MADEMRDLLRQMDRRLRALERRPAQDAYYVHAEQVYMEFTDGGTYNWMHGRNAVAVAWWATHDAGTSSVHLHPEGDALAGQVAFKAFQADGVTPYTGTLSIVHAFGLFPRTVGS